MSVKRTATSPADRFELNYVQHVLGRKQGKSQLWLCFLADRYPQGAFVRSVPLHVGQRALDLAHDDSYGETVRRCR